MQQPGAISNPSLKKNPQKNHHEKNSYIFFKKTHPKQISSTFLENHIFPKKCILYSMDQPRVDIIKNVLYSASLYFLHFRKHFSILIL